MPSPKIPPRFSPAWFVQVAEEMARNGSDLKTAALEVGIELDLAESARIARRRDFQEILRGEQNKYYAGVANDPSRTKSVALGRMWVAAEKLAKEGEHEKSAKVLEQIAKVEGWAGNEQNINIFSGLTARDISEARDRLKNGAGQGRGIKVNVNKRDGLDKPSDSGANPQYPKPLAASELN